MRFTFLAALLLVATPALADPTILTGDVTKVRDGAPITGVPRIVDGDTKTVDRRRSNINVGKGQHRIEFQ